MTMAQSFIFDAGRSSRSASASPEDVRRERIMQALATPQDMASGMSTLGQAMIYRADPKNRFPVAPGANQRSPLSGLFGLGAGMRQSRGGGLY